MNQIVAIVNDALGNLSGTVTYQGGKVVGITVNDVTNILAGNLRIVGNQPAANNLANVIEFLKAHGQTSLNMTIVQGKNQFIYDTIQTHQPNLFRSLSANNHLDPLHAHWGDTFISRSMISNFRNLP